MVNISTRNQDELSRILDSCLDQIASGSETVDTLVERYPKYKDQLKPALEAADWLQSRREVFNPRPGFVQLSHRRLVNRFKANRHQEESANSGILSWIPAFFQERRLVLQYSALVALTVVLLFVGFQSTSFLIQRSIPGDPLYGTKLAREELQLSMTGSEEDQARLRIEFAQRRVVEMQELVLAGRDHLVDQTFDNFKFQVGKATIGIMEVSKTNESNAAVLTSVFEEKLTKPVRNLVGILDSKPVLASSVFIDTLQSMTAGIFDEPVFEPVIVLATITPTSTATATFTPTMTFTATFTPTFTATILPTTAPTQAVEITPTNTPTNTPNPTSPKVTKTSAPQDNATPIPTVEPTSAPTPTNPPADTPAPPPTNPPEPTPEKTKKPKPTQHPTYQPTNTP
jgi:hypothetical protein